MVIRETSLRKINQVLNRPEIKEFIGDMPCHPLGDDVYYLRLGRGYLVYLIDSDKRIAHLHACLTKGDVGVGWVEKVKEQFEYMKKAGVEKIVTRHVSSHKRASIACRAAGMQKDAFLSADGYHAYEVLLCR